MSAHPQTEVPLARRRRYLARYSAEQCLVNLAGVYDYLEMPYYTSLDIEGEGKEIRPTCKEMLDAYITPLFLDRARLAGLPTPEYYLSNGYFEPPVIIDPINPFLVKSRTVWSTARQHSIAKSLTRNFTYAVCCQEIPPDARVAYFRAVMGWSTSRKYLDLAHAIWTVFHIPVARVRIVVCSDGQVLLSDISQLPFEKLNRRELAHIEETVSWEI